MKLSEKENRGSMQQFFGPMYQGLWEYGEMAPPKVDSAGTHVYNNPSYLSPTCIHIVDSETAYILYIYHDTADEGREW